MESRNQLRQRLRQRRRALSNLDQRQASDGILRQLRLHVLPSLNADGFLGLYLANDGEPNLSCWHNELWRQGLNIALPVMHPFSPKHMLFQRFESNTTMVRNRFGIPEPKLNANELILPRALNTLLIPLVGFDSQGNRLGMGGGFYDRYLSQCQHVHKIGIAHDCQQVESLTTEAWDIPLDAVVTPSSYIDVDQKL